MKQLSLLPKSKILARLTQLEIKKNIFIVGHRLFPIQNPMTMPWDLSIQSESGRQFIPKTIALSFKDINIYYSLFGLELLIPLLITQEHVNDVLLQQDNPDETNIIVRCRVLDVGTYYTDHGLAAGDYLEFQSIVDEDDLFKVHPIFTRNIMKEETDAYFAALDIGLDRAIKKLKFPRDPQTMIGTIFQEAPDSVRENPKGSFSDYYNNSKKLQMYFIDGQSYLWSSGMDTQSLYTLLQNDELLTPIEKQAKNLDKAMSDMGLLLDPDEIEAFIIDELYQGHTVDAALERCFRGIELVGYLPKQIHNIYEKTKAYGLEIEKNYNADSELKSIAELRSQILIFYESFLLWERQVQPFTDPNIKRSPELNELLDIIKIVSNNIRMLNIPGLKLQASEIKELKAGLKTFKDISLELMKAIELQIKFNTKISPKKSITSSDNIQNTAKNQRPKKKKKSRPAAEKHYILKISLAGIEPEIYRNVLIPGNRSLAEVSEIILATMGWQGYHLHLFDIRGQHYGEPSPDDWDPIEDERKIRLDNLKLRKGSHFEYIYDYGDHWVHDITVLETQKAHPEVEQVPLILEGQRACPPEDCGGISGYMDIIELLTKPKHNLTRDEKEIFEWLPSGYDPEKFDIQKIQEVLSKL